MSNSKLVYLDTYVLQQDLRIRLPKSVLSNLYVEKGKTDFNIFYDSENKSLVLKVKEEGMDSKQAER